MMIITTNNHTRSFTFPIVGTRRILEKSESQKFYFFKPNTYYDEIQLDKNSNTRLQSFIDRLGKKSSFSEMIQLFENRYSNNPKHIVKRINYLRDVFEPDDDTVVSLGSLAGLLIFLYSVKDSWKPTITLNDSGYFHLRWEKNKSNLVSLEFRENYFLNYVIFMPSLHQLEQPAIVNGSMNVLDFKDFLSKLEVKLG